MLFRVLPHSASLLPLRALGLGGALFGVCIAGSIQTAGAAAGLSTIKLEADRKQLLADGKSVATLTARVYDGRGGAVRDGALVRFSTTAGRLEAETVAVQNGVARVRLIAGNLPASAIVTANVDGEGGAVPQTIVIAFGSDPDAAYNGSDWVRVTSGRYVGYVVDFGLIQVIGGKEQRAPASVAYKGLEVQADEIQLNLRENRVRARGNVVLRRGGGANVAERRYANLRFDLLENQGVGERDVDGRPTNVVISGAQLTETNPDTAAPVASPEGTPAPTIPLATPDAFTFEEVGGARMTIVARSIDVEPNNRLQFRRATFYLDGQKALSLPFHVMALGQETLFSEQVLGYGPSGVTFDFPLYYDVRPSAIGTLHVRHGERFGGSAYATRPGWTLDLEHSYTGGKAATADGRLAFSGLTRRDWNAHWTHAQRLDGATRGQIYLDVPGAGGLFGNALITRQFKGFRVNLNVSGSRASGVGYDNAAPGQTTPTDPTLPPVIDPVTGQPLPPGAPLPASPARLYDGSLRGQLDAQTDDQGVPGVEPLRYTLSLSTARQTYFGKTAPGAYFVHDAGVRLFTAPIRLPGLGQTRLTPLVSVGQAWTSGSALSDGAARSGLSLLGTLSLNHSLGRRGAATLVYDYSQRPQVFATARGRHRFAASLSLLGGERWNLALAGSQTLGGTSFRNLYGTLGFALGGPWRGPDDPHVGGRAQLPVHRCRIRPRSAHRGTRHCGLLLDGRASFSTRFGRRALLNARPPARETPVNSFRPGAARVNDPAPSRQNNGHAVRVGASVFLRACSRRAVLAYPFRPDKNATQENIMPLSPRHDDTRPGSTISAKAADTVLFPDSRPDDRVLEEDLTKK
jgi:hypothetical protein